MIEEESKKNYLLDYRVSGNIGPMSIITLNFAVGEKDAESIMEWLAQKILTNKREFTLGEYGPFKEVEETTPQTQSIRVADNGNWSIQRNAL